ncbi:MAG: cytochrome oxidase biogenesis protein CtaA [Verrucomicrobia bacterium]|nr:cytochrome oxidase biogenesis protein CtaA [Verrucomicrobiota bacterium]
MTRSNHSLWLNRFAVFTALATLILIGIGGLVTSHGAGLSVPDWPTTYGYNMFLFPPSYWMGGILYEHTHRLFASFVGLLTTILAAWLWIKEPRRWVRWLGVAAFFGVVLQGVLGGLRVTLLQNSLGFVHATAAQLFLLLVSIIALVTSAAWANMAANETWDRASKGLRYLLLAATSLVFLQLILGATMRHQHAGLAVPDFPLAYGKLWPPTGAAFIDSVNARRMDLTDPNPITAFQIVLHMTHRLGALVTLLAVGACAWLSRLQLGGRAGLSKASLAWLGLIAFQAALGAATVLSRKAADVATLHVMAGAASLVAGGLLCLAVRRFSFARSKAEDLPSQSGAALRAPRTETALTTG